ncbi:MAG: O-acetyltransferase OatA [Pseudomonadota bacterium]|jgi:peptidoglycan/LPS O-acetylase OafA/YrhL
MVHRYHPEVDGLRTVAVLPVLLFHAGLGVTGGYVGVDVFFVISGFLITGLILHDGTDFSFVKFWERRLRRIAPAATVVVFTTLVVGWFVLFPRDLVNLGRSVVAQEAFVANIYFWRDLNYFAVDEARPLLHAWSLAVEEQFYFCLPLLLFVLRRVSKDSRFYALAAATLVSFVCSVHGVRAHPSATFYLLPTRAWELLIGATIAVRPELTREHRWTNELLAFVGLASILSAALLYTENTAFPGEAALLPCLGAGAVLVSNRQRLTLTGRLLASPALASVGKLSYSLYLWHWPLLVYAGYMVPRLGTGDRVALLLLSAGLAWLTWKYVEQPLRRRSVLTHKRHFFAAVGTSVGAGIVVGLALSASGGAPSRWSEDVLRYAQGKSDSDFRVELLLESARSGELIGLGQPDQGLPIELLVWGDSHAMSILHAVDMCCSEHHFRCTGATHSATAPLLDFPAENLFSLREQAPQYNQAVADFVANHRVKRVLLTAFWSSYRDEPAGKLEASLRETVRVLRHAGAEVFLMKDVPVPSFDVPIALARTAAVGGDVATLSIPLAQHRKLNARVNAVLESFSNEGVHVVDPTSALRGPTGRTVVALDGYALYFDHHHLSTHGAMRLRPVIDDVLAASAPSL